MQKRSSNLVLQKALFVLVLCCLSNSLCASSADQTTHNYDQKKTAQLKKLITKMYNPMLYMEFSNAIRSPLNIPVANCTQVIKLIEQGADPNAQDVKFHATALHAICKTEQSLETLVPVLARLCFLSPQLDRTSPRMILYNRNFAPDFDAVMAATDAVRNMKKQETNKARLPFLMSHVLVVALGHTVNEYSDDAFWDETCLPAIQEYVQRAKKPTTKNMRRFCKTKK